MTNIASSIAPDLADRTRRRIARRLLPFVFLLYIVAFLDRVNVAYAALQMTRDLGFGPKVMGLGAGIFFIGYFLLEIPGAIIVERWSARKWIARIMISWGLVTVLVAFVRTANQYYWARFLLGMAEAGFFPGIIVYLTHWFRAEDRAKALAMFAAAVPFSNVIGSPVAGAILGVNWMGIPGWRWIFVLEGIPAVVFGIVTIFYLTDWPGEAKWLAPDERDWIVRELEEEKRRKAELRSTTIGEALRDPKILLLAAVYFFAVTGSYGISIWLPTMIKRLSGLPNLTVTLISGAPYVLGCAIMIYLGRSSDRTGERRWHAALPLIIAGVSLAASVYFAGHLFAAIVLLGIATAFVWTFLPSFWSLPTAVLTESAAAASIGLINSVGNLGGFSGPYIVGYLQEATGSTAAGMIALVTSIFLAATLVLRFKAPGRAFARNG